MYYFWRSDHEAHRYIEALYRVSPFRATWRLRFPKGFRCARHVCVLYIPKNFSESCWPTVGWEGDGIWQKETTWCCDWSSEVYEGAAPRVTLLYTCIQRLVQWGRRSDRETARGWVKRKRNAKRLVDGRSELERLPWVPRGTTRDLANSYYYRQEIVHFISSAHILRKEIQKKKRNLAFFGLRKKFKMFSDFLFRNFEHPNLLLRLLDIF